MIPAVLVVVAGLLAGCGIDRAAVSTGAGRRPAGPGQIEPPTTTPTTAEPPIDDEDLRAVAADVEAFWEDTLPDVYGLEYEPVDPDRIIAATPDTDLPTCDGEQITYDDVEGNAFAAPCPEGELVVWDDAGLIPDLDERFGPVAAAVVLAHEWGHIAQFQGGVDVPDVIAEQQADCFAGAWLADLLDDPGSLDQLAGSNPLDASLSSVVEFRDDPGSSADDPGAHGSGFDRVRALQEGFDRGADYCARYADSPPPIVELPFTSEEDLANNGNLPLEELVPLVVEDLNAFYGRVVDQFSGATAEDVFGDEDTSALLTDLSDRIGDSAAGLVLGMIWASFAQEQVGADEGRDETGQLLQQACMSGGWLASAFNEGGTEDRPLSLSPGDLDEAILALIDLGGSAGSSGGDEGAAFELVASLRQGVVEGFDSCGLDR